jgi:hypothetical protein
MRFVMMDDAGKAGRTICSNHKGNKQ